MKFRKRILWGIILLMLTAGLFLSVFFPEISPFYGIAVWKWFLGAVLLYWFIDHAVFGKSLCEHFDVFLPLGLGFMLFKSDIGRLSGVDFDLVNNWAVLGISVLLTVVVHLLFGSRSNDSDSTEETSSNNNETHRKRILWRIILLMLTAGLFLSVFFPAISQRSSLLSVRKPFILICPMTPASPLPTVWARLPFSFRIPNWATRVSRCGWICPTLSEQ